MSNVLQTDSFFLLCGYAGICGLVRLRERLSAQ